MADQHARPPNHHVVAATDCFWAVLAPDDVGVKRFQGRLTAATRGRLTYAFEDVLPVPSDELACGFRRINSTTMVACGIRSDRAEEARNAGAVSLKAERVPPELVPNPESAAPVDPPEVLLGKLDPIAIRRSRARAGITLLATGLIIAAIVWVGTSERVGRTNAATVEARAAADSARARALGVNPGSEGPPLAAQMTAEVRRVRAAAASAGPGIQTSLAADLASLMRSWPDAELRLESLVVTESALSIRVIANQSADSESIAGAVANTGRWSNPRLSKDRRRDTAWSVSLVSQRQANLEENR